ncbi:hypothetical protein [Nitrosospira briensis]|uniref:hypothetical protein n=1 Tax=Nitrosospira briensis TaxID=35799 RepID=UPI0008F07F9B|nr:hypothetical protein [Nitrosospira briensis]SFO38482.1 hypothetical protein SAMN05216332_1135 [Nitrosospira briensis]
MGLSSYLLGQMGFELIPENKQIEAYFKSLNVYEIRGISSDKKSPLIPGKLKKITSDFSFSIGDSVNAVCNVLIGDEFADDEEKWRSETKSTPPYLIVLTSLTKPAFCTYGYWKHENNEIITYDCFSEAKQSLQKEENKKTSALVTSLSVVLSSDDRIVSFLPVSREVIAETNHGERLRDFKLSVSAEGYGSMSVTAEALSAKIDSALSLYDGMHSKVGYFFDLAMREKDKLKAFIYYFLVIEIHTHNTFKEIDYCAKFTDLHNLSERIEKSAREFFVDSQKESKNILQRFIWCSILKWSEVRDSDIDAFKALKKIRDKIYHGEEVAEKFLPIPRARSLALKLLRS